MGNFEISSIKKNEELKKLAVDADKKFGNDEKTSGNGNNKIDTIFEESALRGKIRKGLVEGTLKQDDELNTVMKALGLNIEKENKEGITITKPTKASKNVFEDSIGKTAKKVNSPDELINALRAKYIGQTGVPAEYRELLSDATAIYSAVKATNYKTKDDVEKIHNTVKKQLKANKKYTGINKEVLEAFEKLAEKEVKNKEFMALVDRFNAVKSTMSNTEIVKKQGDHYKAYLDIVKDQLKKDGTWKKSYTKDAFDMLEKYAKDLSFNTNVAAAKAEFNGVQAPTKDISFDTTKENEHVDNLLTVRKNTDNRIEEMKSLTRKEIQDALGKELTAKLGVYIKDHTNPVTGKIDLSGLVTDEAEGIIHHISDSDRTMNRNYDDSQLDERHWTRVGLERLTGATLSDKEAQKIAEFANIPVQHKSHNLWKATKKNLPMLATGAVVGATFGLYADQSVVINTSADLASELMSQLGSKATKTVSADGQTASIKIRQIADLRILAAAGGALEALAMGILTDVILGMKENEKTCFSTLKSRQYKDLAALQKHVEAEYPDKAQAIMTMAKMPRFMNDVKTEEGDTVQIWDPNKFYDYLDSKIAGQGSVINHDECLMADMTIKPETGKKVDGEKFKEDDTKVNTTHVDKEVTTLPNARHYNWDNVTKIYACFDGMPQLQATRAMEVIQAIDPDKLNVKGQYNIDRITDIVAKAFKSNFKPNYEYINTQLEKEYPEVSKDALKAVLNATYLGTAITKDNKENKIVTPDELYDTNGTVVCIRDLSKLKRPNRYGNGSAKNNVGVKTGYGEDTRTTSTSTHYYIRENGKVREVGKAEYDASPYKVGKRNK